MKTFGSLIQVNVKWHHIKRRHFALLSRLKYVVSQIKRAKHGKKYFTPFTTVLSLELPTTITTQDLSFKLSLIHTRSFGSLRSCINWSMNLRKASYRRHFHFARPKRQRTFGSLCATLTTQITQCESGFTALCKLKFCFKLDVT